MKNPKLFLCIKLVPRWGRVADNCRREREREIFIYQKQLPKSFRSVSLACFLTVTAAGPDAFLWYVFCCAFWVLSDIMTSSVFSEINRRKLKILTIKMCSCEGPDVACVYG